VRVKQTVNADGSEGAGREFVRVEVGVRGVQNQKAAVIAVKYPMRRRAGFE
jgi:hypothetical protein